MSPSHVCVAHEQEVRPGDERLVPKVHVNLGITLEADGRLLAACNHYQCVIPPALARVGVKPTMHALLRDSM